MILQSPILSGSVQISGSIVLNDGPISATANIVSSSTVVDTFTSSTTKVVNHGFDTKNVFVQVYNNSDDLINPGSITTTDTNNVTITFPTPVSGRVIVGKSGHLVSGSATAESVEFDNILNKPALVSGSLDFANITNKPTLVSGSNIASASVATTAERVQAGDSGSRDLTTPQSGSLWYNTDTSNLEVYTGVSGSEWAALTKGPSAVTLPSTFDLDYINVAGGGGGGTDQGGGGGAGGYLSGTISSVDSGSSFTIAVGAGGAGGPSGANAGISGGDTSIAGSTITTITSTGGGGGAGLTNKPGLNGGSGGGGAAQWTVGGDLTGGSGTVGQGNDGGSGTSGANTSGGGGGGGSSTQGVEGGTSGANNGGDGGDGTQSSITGTATYYAGGGGGGSYQGTSAGAGGQGGGGTGLGPGSSGTAGAINTGDANTGGGGGGGLGNSTVIGGAGGSGVTIFAYTTGSTSSRLSGGIVGDAGNGNKYHQFNTGGTLKVGGTNDFSIVTDSLVMHLDAGNFTSRGTSTWTDLQGTYNGTVSGATLGNNFYYDFNGSSNYIDLGTTSPFTDRGFTVEFWTNLDNTTTSGGFLTEWGTGTDRLGFWKYPANENKIHCAITDSSNTYRGLYSSEGAFTANTWQHITVVIDTSTAYFYTDGSLLSSTSIAGTGIIGGSTNLNIGRQQNSTYLDGQIAQMRVYSKVLTATEILQNYNATKTNFV